MPQLLDAGTFLAGGGPKDGPCFRRMQLSALHTS
jgi:hypothetical protein